MTEEFTRVDRVVTPTGEGYNIITIDPVATFTLKDENFEKFYQAIRKHRKKIKK